MHDVRISTILCPTDLSPESDGAIRYGVALARTFAARMVILHCAVSRDGRRNGRVRRGVRGLFEASLARHAGDGVGAAIEWDGVVIDTDDIGAAISDEAARRGVDLIVMRSRRRPHRAALLGSTAEEVCRIAPCPVLVTHSDERELVDDATQRIRLDRILIAQDFSDDSELAVQYGLSLAKLLGGRVDLLHVLPRAIPDQPEALWSPDAAEQAYHRAAHLLGESIPSTNCVETAVAHAVRWGKPYAEILSFAQEQHVDLLCMGARGAGHGMWSLFGSNVDRVLRQAPCPLLIVRPLKPTGAIGSKSAKSNRGASRSNHGGPHSVRRMHPV